MNRLIRTPWTSKSAISLATATLAVFSALSAPAISAKDDPANDVDKLMVVDCMLPGKIMRLGTGARYMSARRPIKTTGADCEIRGGEYVAYDRASYASSLKVWLPGAKAGDPKAQTYVGEMFEQGLGTMPDYATAVAWYRKAAEQGFERAQMNLGSMYERGLGVEQDELEALNWYRRATGLEQDELVFSSEVETLEAEAEDLRVALAASEAEVSQLRDNLNVSQRQLNNSKAGLDNSLLELEQLRFKAAQSQSAPSQNVDVSALNEEIRLRESALAAQRKELKDLRAAYDQQQAQLAAQLDTQEGDQNSYQALLDLERERMASLENQVTQLTGSLASRQDELDSSNVQLDVLRRQLEAQAANDRAATDESITELSAIIEQQKASLDRKSLDTSELRSELESQRRALAAEQNEFREREQSLLQNADSTTSEQQAALAQQRSEIVILQGQVDGLAREVDLKESNLDQSNSQLELLTRQLQAANDKQASSEESMAKLSETIAVQQANLEQKALSIGFLEQELTNHKQQLASERSAYDEREQRFRDNSDLLQVEQQTLQARIQQTEGQISSYQTQLQESDRLIEHQQTEIQDRQQQIAQLENEQQRWESAQIRNLDTELGKQSIELVAAQGENAALQRQIDEYKSQMDRLRAQLAMADSDTSVAMRGTFTPLPLKPRARADIPDVDFGNYYALIIGNNAYTEFPQLKTPVNDAQAIARILQQKYRFKTEVLINADRAAILRTINRYRERLTGNDNFLLYYAGHGDLDEKNNRGHWLPVDASPVDTTNWISNEDITSQINIMEAKHIMVIADSCYSGTLTRSTRTSLSRGTSKAKSKEFYEKLANKKSRTVLTSGGEQPVMDGGGGAHSIFANGLLNTLEANEQILPSPDLFYEVHQHVSSSGLNEMGQTPAYDVIHNTGDVMGRFFFVPG